MKRHSCKILLIILAALLCLFLVSGVILGKMFSSADIPADTADVPEAEGIPGAADAAPAETAPAGNSAANVAETEGASAEPDAVETEGASAEPDAVETAAITAPQDASTRGTVPMLRCLHFTEKEFLRSVNDTGTGHSNSILVTDSISKPGITPIKPAKGDIAPQGPAKGGIAPQGPAKGGIAPHHLLAGRMIAAFFSDLAQNPPETIVVIGPNHSLSGINSIHTSTANWGTPFGTLEANGELASKIIQKAKATENNTLMEEEHSISSLVPYIKYYLPETKIVPVILHGAYTKEQSEELGTLLADSLSERPDTFILASIDFSHYLDVFKADKMDAITLDAINSWDIDELGEMGNDNLDSPPSIITLLTVMEIIGAKEIEVTGHSNSSKITSSGYDYTTSYFTMFFRKIE